VQPLLDTPQALDEGLAWLAAADPVMARIIAEGARPRLRKREPGFEGLAAIVVSQQVSTASAKAIWGRVKERYPALCAQDVAGAQDEALRGCGLSAPKIRTLRAVSTAVLAGEVPLDDLHLMPADEAHAALVSVKGIGPWTADIYLLFCLGHPDAFAAGDLALQEGARLAYDLPERPKPDALTALAERWRPWRGAAAKVLWAHYGIVTGRIDPATLQEG
jgi:DNA-3-methyladenine glycosylase II